MGIELSKLIDHLDDVKIEAGLLGGRTLVFEGVRFKMNALVKRLVLEKPLLTPLSLKKIEKLNHALPENLSLIQKFLTLVRQFFGNLIYNRDKDLFSLSLLYQEVRADSLLRFRTYRQADIPLEKQIEPATKSSVKPSKNISFKKEEPSKKEEPKQSPLQEPPPQEAKPKLSRTKSFKITDIYQTLREKNDIDDIALVSFAKDIEATLAVTDKDYFVKLNSVIHKICGEPLIRYENAQRVEVAFKNPGSVKILQYALIRLFTTDKMNFVSKSRLIENIAAYFSADLLKAFFEAYIVYIKTARNYYPDKMDDTFKHLMVRFTELSKENPTYCDLFKKEDIAIGIGSTILKDVKEAGWLEELVDRYKSDKQLLTCLDAFLKAHLKPNERRVCRDKVISYLEA